MLMTPSGKNILIAGATGFVGSHIANTLKEEGYRVLQQPDKLSPNSGDVHWVNVKLTHQKSNLLNSSKNTPTAAIVHAAGLINRSNSAITGPMKGSPRTSSLQSRKPGQPDFLLFKQCLSDKRNKRLWKKQSSLRKLIHEKVKGRYVILRSSLIFGPGDSKTSP